MLIYDYHTHTIYSHGKGTIEDNVKEAIKKGLKSIAISDHGPGHVTYGIKRKNLDIMKTEIEELNIKYKEIDIKLGIEANIINQNGELLITKEEIDKIDILMAGYHYGAFGNYKIKDTMIHIKNAIAYKLNKPNEKLKKYNTEMIVNTINRNNIDVITHLGSKAHVSIREIARACGANNTLMEINNSHGHLTVEAIEEAAKEDVKFVIGSDAHVPEKVGNYEKSLKRAKEANLDLTRIVNLKKKG